ncbi:MAG TPA: hypothetical protein VF120_08785 [Ktedonobacterales bacterium]
MDLHPSDQPRTSSVSVRDVSAQSRFLGETASGGLTAPALPAALSSMADSSDPRGWLPCDPNVSDPSASGPSAFDSGSFIRRYESQGPEENRRAALAYVPPIALAYFLGRRASPYLRFHAAQGLAFELIAIALVIGHWLIFGALDSVQSLAMVFFEIGLTWIFALVCLVLAGLWVWGILAALAGKDTSLPLIGQLGARLLEATRSLAA